MAVKYYQLQKKYFLIRCRNIGQPELRYLWLFHAIIFTNNIAEYNIIFMHAL